jgi:hypothetical protein
MKRLLCLFLLACPSLFADTINVDFSTAVPVILPIPDGNTGEIGEFLKFSDGSMCTWRDDAYFACFHYQPDSIEINELSTTFVLPLNAIGFDLDLIPTSDNWRCIDERDEDECEVEYFEVSYWINGQIITAPAVPNPGPIHVTGLPMIEGDRLGDGKFVIGLGFGDDATRGGTITNFSYTVPSQIPEPASITLVSLGALLPLTKKLRSRHPKP